MKKIILAFAALSVLSATASAQSSVQMFGVVDAAVRSVKNGSLGSMNSVVSSGNSAGRFGIRGSEDLGGGLKAQFWLEMDVNPDTGTGGDPMWNRRSTVSLSDDRWGELRLGRDYTPTHVATCNFDIFNCVGVASIYGLRTMQSTALAAATGLGGIAPLTRANNAVNYLTPTVGGFMGQLMLAAPEGNKVGAVENSRLRGARAAYAAGPVNIQIAAISLKNLALTGSPTFKDVAASFSYDFDIVKIGLQHRQQSVRNEKLAISTINAMAPYGSGFFKVQFERMNQSGTNAANDGLLAGFGYEHNLSKRTALYTNVARLTNKGTGFISIPGGPTTTAANFAGGRSTGYELGIRHNF